MLLLRIKYETRPRAFIQMDLETFKGQRQHNLYGQSETMLDCLNDETVFPSVQSEPLISTYAYNFLSSHRA